MRSEDIIEINRHRSVSQTTGFICAKCGKVVKLTNRELLPFQLIKESENLARINFNCPKCDDSYDFGLVYIHG